MFVIILTYIAPIEQLDALIPAHRQFLDKQYALEKFICSGAQIPRNGGIMLCNANDKEEVNRIIACDPFFIEGVAQYDIIEFTPSKFAAAFQPFIP